MRECLSTHDGCRGPALVLACACMPAFDAGCPYKLAHRMHLASGHGCSCEVCRMRLHLQQVVGCCVWSPCPQVLRKWVAASAGPLLDMFAPVAATTNKVGLLCACFNGCSKFCLCLFLTGCLCPHAALPLLPFTPFGSACP